MGSYQQRRLDPDKIYQVLSQIEEIFRFARRDHRREIVRALCREIEIKRDGEVEISIALPQETALQRLSTTTGSGCGGVYPASLQWDPVTATIALVRKPAVSGWKHPRHFD